MKRVVTEELLLQDYIGLGSRNANQSKTMLNRSQEAQAKTPDKGGNNQTGGQY